MSFELQPALTGELLQLRPLRVTDWDALYDVARDPLIWEQHPSSDRWKEPVFRAFFREAIESGGALAAIGRAGERGLPAHVAAVHRRAANFAPCAGLTMAT
ncbi:MAG: hypothetical protein IT452_22215 [Planctomycetia bacterium]|nr:hypothetical protein [Planctomycetia bacterium]